MIPSTGSATWDTVGQIAIVCLMLVSLVMMWRRR
ncbi:LPXTG cell wall anchor domain-containing protein [Klenkia soli]|nr:LPXTG cell wall anchor domain-containing protein [Klenkia soli]